MHAILCPTDFSETSRNAIVYAARLAGKTGAKLVLYHIQSLLERSPQEIIKGEALTEVGIQSELGAVSAEVARAFGISCEYRVHPSEGSVTKILALAAEPFDLVVMGTAGPKNLTELTFGSDTYKVSVQATVPLLIIPSECEYMEIKRIVYAFDFAAGQELPLKQLGKFARAVGSEVVILRVAENQEVSEPPLAAYENVKFSFEVRTDTDPGAAINSYVLEKKPEVLALCAIHHNFLEGLFHKSTVKRISGYAKYPVFVFHY